MKKKVFIYGNCHTMIFSQFLGKCKEFNDNYEIVPVKQIQEIQDISYFEQLDFSKCDVFIHQSIRKNNRYGEEYASERLIERLNPECTVIAIPNVYHLPVCLYPQYTEDVELRYQNCTYFFRDSIIDEGIREGKSIKKIVEQYYDFRFDRASICNEFERFINKIRRRENDWDIKVSDYIVEKIKKEQLFYDPNHPTNFLIKYYVIETLKILLNSNEIDLPEVNVCRLDSFEMPLLQDVVSALDLEYNYEQRDFRITGKKVCRTRMKIEQYVKQYYSMIWTCGSFERKDNYKSYLLFYVYRLKDFVLRVIGVFGRPW